MGHIISRDGIKIDPDRVNAILKVGKPRSKQEIQSFLGHVNFMRRFIPNFAEILMNITNIQDALGGKPSSKFSPPGCTTMSHGTPLCSFK